jgi:hypothetical protein
MVSLQSMLVDSESQAIAKGILIKLAQNQTPLDLAPLEFAVVAEILNDFTNALAGAAGIPATPIPPDRELYGKVTLDSVDRRMLKTMLAEYVTIPTDPS